MADVLNRNAARSRDAVAYSKEPFAADVSEGKTGALYNAHSYHTKVPPKAIENYIQHFTDPGDVILDGFSGTGMTGVAVHTVNKQRTCILLDLSPAATFISALYNSSVPPDAFLAHANSVLERIEDETQSLYETRHSKPDSVGIIESIVWSTVLICPSCSESVSFWDLAEKGDDLECPKCKATTSRNRYQYSVESYVDPVSAQTRTRNRKVPVQITYKIGSKRHTKAPDKSDLAHLTSTSPLQEAGWFPKELFLGVGAHWGDTYRAGYHLDMNTHMTSTLLVPSLFSVVFTMRHFQAHAGSDCTC